MNPIYVPVKCTERAFHWYNIIDAFHRINICYKYLENVDTCEMFYGSQFEINETELDRIRKMLLLSSNAPKNVYAFQNIVDDLYNTHHHIETETSYLEDYIETVIPLVKRFSSLILQFWSNFPDTDVENNEEYVIEWTKKFNHVRDQYRSATEDTIPVIHYVYQYYCNREYGQSPLGRVLSHIGKYATFIKVIASTFYIYDHTEYNNTLYVHEDCDRLLISDRLDENTLRNEYLLMNLYDIVRPGMISEGHLTPMYKLNSDHVKYRYDLLREKRNQQNNIRGSHVLHSHVDPLIDEYYSEDDDEDSSDGIPIMNEDELEERFENPNTFLTQLTHL